MQTRTYLTFQRNRRLTRNFICAAVLSFLLWGPQTLFADINTLQRIIAAEREVAYIGVRVRTSSSSRGTRTFEEYVIHRSEDASYRKVVSVVGERSATNSPPNRTDRRDDNRRRENNENRRERQDRNRNRNEWRQVRNLFSEKEIELIAENYNLEKSVSAEKIVNYETDVLTITPKFSGRPTKRIFFARENGIILRVEDLDTEGILREMFVYNRISFNEEAVNAKWKTIEKDIRPEQRRSFPITLAEAEKIIKTEPVQPHYLPPGFQLQGVRGIKSRESNSILLEYTDGLVNFTLIEITGKPPRGRRGETPIQLDGMKVYKHRFGSTDAFRWSGKKIHFLLFGAMPTAETQKVVASIIQKTEKK